MITLLNSLDIGIAEVAAIPIEIIIGAIIAVVVAALLFIFSKKRKSTQSIRLLNSDSKKLDTRAAQEYFERALQSTEIKKSTIENLKAAGIKTFSDLRKKGYLKDVKKLKGASAREIRELGRASLLSLLCQDIVINDKLARSNINSIRDLQRLSTEELERVSDGKLDKKQVKIYKNKVHVLYNLIEVKKRNIYAKLRNPASLVIPPEIPQEVHSEIWHTVSGPQETCPLKCDESTNLFSPAVYLLYLLDFVEKSFGNDLDTLEKINERFLQKFEDLSISQDSSQQGSYVQYTNEILENLIAGRPWPNEIVDESERETRNQIKIGLYEKFTKKDGADYVYGKEPGFRPEVLVGLFDSYVQEFGTTRKEINFIMKGSSDLKLNFAMEQNLDTDHNSATLRNLAKENNLFVISSKNDIETINIQNKDISFLNIQDLRTRLLAFYIRKSKNSVKQEFISNIEDTVRLEFQKIFRQTRNEETDNVLAEFINHDIPTGLSNEEYDRELFKKREQAKACVNLGLECKTGSNYPVASKYNNNPINPIRELFKHYAGAYPDYTAGNDKDQYADNKILRHKNAIRDEIYQTLVEEEGGESTLTDEQKALLLEKATTLAEERIRSEEELDKQLHELAKQTFDNDFDITENREAFDYQVNSRAKEQWKTAVSRAEVGFLSKIRTNLIIIALVELKTYFDLHPVDAPFTIDTAIINGRPTVVTEVNIERLANYLHMDLTIDETYRTTPLAFTINRIHSFAQAIRLGIDTQYSLENFDEDIWAWLKSYGIWHAVMMVSMYPENFLIPELRYNKTPQFEDVLENVSMKPPSNCQKTLYSYYKNLLSLTELEMIGIVRLDGRTFVFAKTPNGFFYSVQYDNGKWKSWEKIEGLTNIASEELYKEKTFVGYANYPEEDKHEVYFFTFRKNLVEQEEHVAHEWVLHYAGFQITQEDEIAASNSSEWIEVGEARIGPTIYSVNYHKMYLLRSVHPEGHSVSFRIGYVSENKNESWGFHFYDGSLNDVSHGVILDDFFRGVVGVVNDWTGTATLWSTRYELYLDVGGDRQLIAGVGEHYTGSSGPEIHGGHYILVALGGFSSSDSTPIVCIQRSATDNPIVLKKGTEGFYALDSLKRGVECRNIVVQDQKVHIYGMAYSQIVYATHDAQLGSDSFANPFRLSFGGYTRNLKIFTKERLYDEIRRVDPVRVYLDEYYLHIPILIAERQNEEGLYEKAMDSLALVYNVFGSDESIRRVYPVFEEEGTDFREIGVWLEDPFNPYALCDLHKDSYLLNVKFSHVRNVLDWADRLFTQDTPESINRARELYELAAKILNMHDWPKDDCDLEWYAFRANTESMTAEERSSVTETVAHLSDASQRGIAMRVQGILARASSTPFKIAAIENAESMVADKGTLGVVLASAETEHTGTNGEALALSEISEEALEELRYVTIGKEILEMKEGFCLPMNPMVNLLRWRIESNLAKIRTNRNFAGMERQLQPYAAPVDPAKLVKQAASGGIDFEQFIPSTPPPIFRYSFLLERAKYLVSVAQQFENSMLLSIEKEEEEEYSYMKATQDIRLERGNVNLQGLRLKEANDCLKLAERQWDRAQFSRDHFQQLIDGGISAFEWIAVELLERSVFLPASISFGPSGGVSYSPSGMFQTLANSYSTRASYERRQQEWEYQRDLGQYDIDIADIGANIAKDGVNIIEQEQIIADIRLEFANDTVEFLGNKFTNKDLYKWMKKNLRNLYREQLNMAISTAKAAQRALEFERQSSLDFVGYDYWDEEKQGLLGAEQLLKDINKMDQYRISTASRKKEIEKTISLASIAPAEFQKFKETGVIEFATAPQWFERDFPGHYMRLIRDVRLSIFALIPPNEGIHATLSNTGISRVMVGPPFEEQTIIYRLPESIAVSSPHDATGLFELRPDDPMLMPFEGSGVTTSWKLEMPKGANKFDFNTIVDILVTIRYTALEDRSYRDKVLMTMGQDELGYVNTEAIRYFDIHNEFPDQWYHFHNPIIGENIEYADPSDNDTEGNKPLRPYTMVINLNENNFLPNEKYRKIKKITLAMQKSAEPDEEEREITFKIEFVTKDGSKANDNIKLTSEKTTSSTEAMNGKQPYGKWILQIIYPVDDAKKVDVKWLKDMLFIVEYKAKVHYNR